MKFDKSKVFTATNADEAKKYIGKKGWFSNSINFLEKKISNNTALETLKIITSEDYVERFGSDGDTWYYCFFYPYEPKLIPIDWEHRHLILGKQIREKQSGFEYLVTAVEFIDAIDDVHDKQIVAIVNNKSISSEFLYLHYEFLDSSIIGIEV